VSVTVASPDARSGRTLTGRLAERRVSSLSSAASAVSSLKKDQESSRCRLVLLGHMGLSSRSLRHSGRRGSCASRVSLDGSCLIMLVLILV